MVERWQIKASQTMAKGNPYRKRTSVAARVPISVTRVRWVALRTVCASAAHITIGIQAQTANAGSSMRRARSRSCLAAGCLC